MFSEQKHNISFVRFFFLINIYDMPCERALISALHNLRKHHKICNITLWNSGQMLFGKISGIKLIVFSMFFHQLFMVTALNNASLL